MKRHAGLLLAAVLGLAGCATRSPVPPESIGRVYTYVRSNQDGTDPETVHVFRAREDFIEVAKMRARCTDAALVTAQLDIPTAQATRLVAGRLRPDGTQRPIGWIDWSAEGPRLDMRLDWNGSEHTQALPLASTPWHLYDFDLASLAVPMRAKPQASFAFDLAMVWPGDDPARLLRRLGRAEATYVGEETFEGRKALRFDVGGPAFAGRGGVFFFDAAEGHLLAADLGLPNHPGYRDFRLRLTQIRQGGRATWHRLLTAHHYACH